MSLYFAMMLVPAMAAIAERARPGLRSGSLGIGAFLLAAMLMVGMRFEVGPDWNSYQIYFNAVRHQALADVFARGDPAYALINWVAARIEVEIWFVNSICAAALVFGLKRFLSRQPRPWLALAVAVPYLLIVVGMGYTRQAAALGLVMAGLAALEKGGTGKFLMWTLAAGLFHKSAVVLLPLGLLAEERSKFWTVALIFVVSVVAYQVLVVKGMESVSEIYLERQYASRGALIRQFMVLIPAIVYLYFRRHIEIYPQERRIWSGMACAGVLLMLAFIVSPSSTLVDRFGLYLIPLQIFVLSRLPDFIGPRSQVPFWVMCVVGYCICIQAVFFLFGQHAEHWIPYQLYPLGL